MKTRAIVSQVYETGDVRNSLEWIESYKDYYPLLEAPLFDVVMVNWDGVDISLFVDDEGMMKSGNIGREVQGYPQPLFGNIVICGGVDEDGNTLPLDGKFDVVNVAEYISEAKYIVR